MKYSYVFAASSIIKTLLIVKYYLFEESGSSKAILEKDFRPFDSTREKQHAINQFEVSLYFTCYPN